MGGSDDYCVSTCGQGAGAGGVEDPIRVVAHSVCIYIIVYIHTSH